MKRITLIIIMLLGFTQFSEAQFIASSTSASTQKIRTKSIREKGWVVRPEIGVGYNVSGDVVGFATSVSGTLNYQFNPYIAAGAGLGWDYNNGTYFESRLSHDYAGSFHTVPIFANIRGYFSDRKVSPYYDIKIGYAIGKKTVAYDYYDYHGNISGYRGYYKGKIEAKSKLYFGIGLGVNWKNFDFGLNYSYTRIKYSDVGRYEYSGYYNSYSDSYNKTGKKGTSLLSFRIAYNFQLPSMK